MVINNNLNADTATRYYGMNNDSQANSVEKISSGMRINRAADDTAGLAVSEKMRNQIKGLDQASRNSQDAISLIQTADGALSESQSILQRMRELTVQSLNDTYTESDRDKMNTEAMELLKEIDNIAEYTNFNDHKVLAGEASTSATNSTSTATATSLSLTNSIMSTEYGNGVTYYTYLENGIDNTSSSANDNAEDADVDYLNEMAAVYSAATLSISDSDSGYTFNESLTGSVTYDFHVGANQDQKTSIKIQAMGVIALELENVSLADKESASASLAMIDSAVEQINSQRALLGAVQNRLEHTVKNVDYTSESLQSAESSIRDTDMATEMVQLTKYNILSEASQAMISQANQNPEQVLSLLYEY
ncbi:MAG: hypothetical protein ATN34_00730 [Epulopiscium sp. Nele67-Bin002]|nr:MAG: hypothetical protein BEN18_09005 [Epulopiscium sp. Nuni2H_MBin001]OON91276.1 MAG: hypothetical protein ATN34_00730 [Epulopiscium sp. Nele67-Bin002]